MVLLATLAPGLAACYDGALATPTSTSLSSWAPTAQVMPTNIVPATTIPVLSPSPVTGTGSFSGRVLQSSQNATEPMIAILPDAPDRDLYRLASHLLPDVPAEIPRGGNSEPLGQEAAGNHCLVDSAWKSASQRLLSDNRQRL